MREVSARQNEHINETLTKSLTALQENNEKKLEQMRMTVDEKLTDTLSKRLDSSFKVVGEQLKSVYESLGEMRKITGDVTALQRVLTNVKARGTWAEVQLGNILEQTLTKDQYDCNVSTKMIQSASSSPLRSPPVKRRRDRMAPHRLQVPARRLHTHLRGCRKSR